MELELEGRVAIVTGATRGIGREVARELAREGCRLVVCGRGEDVLAGVVEELNALGAEAHAVAVDLLRPEAADTIVDAARERFGVVDILINNAGVGLPKRLLELTDEDWHETFELNFFAPSRLSAACVAVMLERQWGRIVNVCSTQASEPDPLFGPYAASKAALLNLTKVYARAFSRHGVLTNAVVPGITGTEMVQANMESAAAAMKVSEEEVMARTLAKDPIAVGRIGTVEEVATAIVFMASPRAGWITGTALAVDGGTLRSI
jgi:3-oxoacyl-[acyl-carrier protein] reductase